MNAKASYCPLCASPQLQSKPFGYHFNGRWLEGTACRDCGIIFIDPQPTAAEIAQMYAKEYFEGDFRCGHAGSYFDERTLQRLADQTLLQRIQRCKRSGKFLEVGCAGGAFLNAACEAGFEVRGVEFAEAAARFARERFGLQVSTGEVQSVKFSKNTFDIVFMGDVLEHLPDPLITVKELHRIMAPEGLLVIACPTQTNTLFSRLGFLVYAGLGKKATVHLPPYHLFEYRPQSLRRFLQRCGFAIAGMTPTMMSPREIALRGSLLQRLGKKMLQYPNYFLTKSFGVYGDRIEVFAIKHAMQ